MAQSEKLSMALLALHAARLSTGAANAEPAAAATQKTDLKSMMIRAVVVVELVMIMVMGKGKEKEKEKKERQRKKKRSLDAFKLFL